MPILTTDVVAGRVATSIDDNADNDKGLTRVSNLSAAIPCLTHNDGDDLEKTEPVFKLAICSDGDDVGSNQGEPEDETERPAGKVVRPVLQDELQGDQIRSSRDGIVEPVVPRQSKAKRIIDETTTGLSATSIQINKESHLPSKRAEAAGHGYKGRHLAQTQHGDEDDGAHDSVADQHGRRPAGGERLARAEEQPRADGAANGNHLHLARRQRAVEAVGLDGAVVELGARPVRAVDVVELIFARRVERARRRRPLAIPDHGLGGAALVVRRACK